MNAELLFEDSEVNDPKYDLTDELDEFISDDTAGLQPPKNESEWMETPAMPGTFEHTAHLAFLIKQAKKQQRSLTVILLNLKNAFGEFHHRLILTVLQYHHIPELKHIKRLSSKLKEEFYKAIV